MKPKIGHLFVDYEGHIYILLGRVRGGWNYLMCLRHTLKTSIWPVSGSELKNWYKTDGTYYVKWVC